MTDIGPIDPAASSEGPTPPAPEPLTLNHQAVQSPTDAEPPEKFTKAERRALEALLGHYADAPNAYPATIGALKKALAAPPSLAESPPPDANLKKLIDSCCVAYFEAARGPRASRSGALLLLQAARSAILTAFATIQEQRDAANATIHELVGKGARQSCRKAVP